MVAARNKERLEWVAEDCSKIAGRKAAALAVQTDITNESEVRDLVNRVLAKYASELKTLFTANLT